MTKTISDETRKKIGDATRNRNYSDEKKAEISLKTSNSLKNTHIKNRAKKVAKYKEQFEKVDNGTLTVFWDTFIAKRKKIKTIDKDHGEWWTTVSSLVQGITHPKRHTEKVRQTCIERYGVDSPMKTSEVKDKIKKTCLEKYGVDCVAKTDNWKKKQKEICLEKYGVEFYCQSEDFRNKFEASSINKYGVKHPFQSETVKNKIKETCQERYGVDWTGAIPGVKEQRESTCEKLYGVKHCSQNGDIALKIARSTNNSYIKTHWQTNEELVCQGSYESKVVDYLNTNKIEYLWQPEVFKLSTGKTYRPDLYLIKEDIWIEIKGWFRDDGLCKWNEFHTLIKTNSVLWDKIVLKSMRIL